MLKSKYESIIVFSIAKGEEAANAVIGRFTDLINSNAEDVVVNVWGVRELAYPINYETKAIYVQYNFECGRDFPQELIRITNITESVLRAIVVNADGTDITVPVSEPVADEEEEEEAVAEEAEEVAEEAEEAVEEAEAVVEEAAEEAAEAVEEAVEEAAEAVEEAAAEEPAEAE